MKTLFFAAALLAGTAAVAQTDPMPEPMPATAGTSSPGNTAPERDARGIAVISDPAEVPAGFNPPPGTNTGASSTARPAPMPSTEEYRACTRQITDNCVQTYERGRAPR